MKRDRQPRAHCTRDGSAVHPHPLTLRVRTSVAEVPARCHTAIKSSRSVLRVSTGPCGRYPTLRGAD
jgi:hypothetical protein